MPLDRRKLLGLGAVAALAAAAVSLWQTFRTPRRKRVPRGASRAVIGAANVAPGSAVEFEIGGCPVVLLRLADGSLRAYEASCTHMACTVRWRPDLAAIACPCHAGRFDTEGRPISGPPKEPLDRLTVEERNGTVVVSAPEPRGARFG